MRALVVPQFLAAVGISLVACGGSDASTSSDTSALVLSPAARVRVAHLSPDAPPVDFCLAAHGSADFGKPVLGARGMEAGLSYSQVTRYLELPADTYDIRVVVGTDCEKGVLSETSEVVLVGRQPATIAAIGMVKPAKGHEPSLSAKVFFDVATVAPGQTATRFIHAAPGISAVDVGIGTTADAETLFPNVSFGNVATGSQFTNGYLEVAPFRDMIVTVRLAGQSKAALTVPAVSARAGSITSAFAIGMANAPEHPLQLLRCDDNGDPDGQLANCQASMSTIRMIVRPFPIRPLHPLPE